MWQRIHKRSSVHDLSEEPIGFIYSSPKPLCVCVCQTTNCNYILEFTERFLKTNTEPVVKKTLRCACIESDRSRFSAIPRTACAVVVWGWVVDCVLEAGERIRYWAINIYCCSPNRVVNHQFQCAIHKHMYEHDTPTSAANCIYLTWR